MPPQERDRHDFLIRRETPDTTVEDESSPDPPAKKHDKSAAIDGNEAVEDDEISPGNILQYIICMITNFILHLLGINWLLGIFGLALNPLDALDDTEETKLRNLKEKKRKFDEIEQVVGESGDQEYSKRTKTATDDLDESLNANTEASFVDTNMNMEEKSNIAEKTKAISEFQKRLWKLTPDFSFEIEGNQSGLGFLESEDNLDSPSLNDDVADFGIVNNIIKKKEMLKVITPTDSFDDVLNMSEEEASDAGTGEEIGDVNMGDVLQLGGDLVEGEIGNLKSTSIVKDDENENEDKSVFVEGDMDDIYMEVAVKENKKCDAEKVKDVSANTDFIVEDAEYYGSLNGLDENHKVSDDQNQFPNELMIQIKTPLVENLTEIELKSTQGVATLECVEETEFDDISISASKDTFQGDKASFEEQVNQCGKHFEVGLETTEKILNEEILVNPGEKYDHPQVGNQKENESNYTGAHQQYPNVLANSCQFGDLVAFEQGLIINGSKEEKDAEMKIDGDYELKLVVNQADIESNLTEEGQRSSINADPYNFDEIDTIGNNIEVSVPVETSGSVACENSSLVPCEEEDREVMKSYPENGVYFESVNGLDVKEKATDLQDPEYKVHSQIETPHVENINETEIECMGRVESDDTSGQVEVCNIDLVQLRDEKLELDQAGGGLRKVLDGEILENLSEEYGNDQDSCHSSAINIDFPSKEKYTQLNNFEDFELVKGKNQSDIGSNLDGKRDQRSSNNEVNDEIDTIIKENKGYDFPLDQLVAVEGENSTLPPPELEQVREGLEADLGLEYSSNDVKVRACAVQEESLPFEELQDHQLDIEGNAEHTKTALVSYNESVESESRKEASGCLQKEYDGFSDKNMIKETVPQEDFLSDMIKDFKLEGTKDVPQSSTQLDEESVPESELSVHSVDCKLDHNVAVECTDDSTGHGIEDENGQLQKEDEEIEEEGVGVRRGSVGSKGRWGQKSSGKKKKKRKIL